MNRWSGLENSITDRQGRRIVDGPDRRILRCSWRWGTAWTGRRWRSRAWRSPGT